MCRLPYATLASIVLRFGMLMRVQPGGPPEQPPRRTGDADTYLFALSITALVVAVLILAYALFMGY